MDTNGQNLGGFEWDDAEVGRMVRRLASQRHAIESLAATVKRLERENDELLEGCLYGLKCLEDEFGPDSPVTRTLAAVVESHLGGAT